MPPDLLPVRKNDIEVGKPLPWPVYDAAGNLLLREGHIIQSERQLKVLQDDGLFLDRARLEEFIKLSRKRDTVRPDYDVDAAAAAEGERFAFSDIRLAPGEILQMRAPEPGHPKNFVRYIGYFEKGSVLVSTPVADHKTLFVKEGQGFELRVFSGRRIFTFSTVVLRSCLMPYPYLHLSYPASVKGVLVRTATRTEVDLICSVLRDGERAPGRIRDLSIGGALVEAARDLGAPGDNVQIAFKIVVFEEEILLNLAATIRRCDPYHGGVRVGMQFGELPLNDRLALQSLLYYHLMVGG